MSQVAIITGGASGMGLEVARVLAAKGHWILHLFDMNEDAGQAAAASLPNATFHKVNVIDYGSISTAFEKVFVSAGRLDFVFANAGIVERHSFYEPQEVNGTKPPPEPNVLSLTINLNGVITTTWLAAHYFRLSPHKGRGAAIVMTASCGGLYPSQFSPVYSASKAGVINFMRSIAYSYRANDGIRVYATCPGTVRTNLLNSVEWSAFPDEFFTPVEKIASTVVMLVEGGDMEDSNGRKIPADQAYGLAAEINGSKHYFREPVDFCDDNMRQVMLATSMENQEKYMREGKRAGEPRSRI